jgi:hypothetical protein
MEDEGRYSRLRQKRHNKFILYLGTRSFNHQLLLLVKFKVEEVYLFCLFLNAQHFPLKFQRVYASFNMNTITTMTDKAKNTDISIAPNRLGFCLKTVADISLRNVVLLTDPLKPRFV